MGGRPGPDFPWHLLRRAAAEPEGLGQDDYCHLPRRSLFRLRRSVGAPGRRSASSGICAGMNGHDPLEVSGLRMDRRRCLLALAGLMLAPRAFALAPERATSPKRVVALDWGLVQTLLALGL